MAITYIDRISYLKWMVENDDTAAKDKLDILEFFAQELGMLKRDGTIEDSNKRLVELTKEMEREHIEE